MCVCRGGGVRPYVCVCLCDIGDFPASHQTAVIEVPVGPPIMTSERRPRRAT